MGRLVARRPDQHGGEDLGGQIGGELWIDAARTPADDEAEVPTIKRAERPIVTARDRGQQLRIAPPSTISHESHHQLHTAPHGNCDQKESYPQTAGQPISRWCARRRAVRAGCPAWPRRAPRTTLRSRTGRALPHTTPPPQPPLRLHLD